MLRIALLASVLAAPAHAVSCPQGDPAADAAYVAAAMGHVEEVLAATPQRLYVTQLVIREGFARPDVVADGAWGPVTAGALCDLLSTYTAINGAENGVRSREDAAAFERWIVSAAYAAATGGEFPD